MLDAFFPQQSECGILISFTSIVDNCLHAGLNTAFPEQLENVIRKCVERAELAFVLAIVSELQFPHFERDLYSSGADSSGVHR